MTNKEKKIWQRNEDYLSNEGFISHAEAGSPERLAKAEAIIARMIPLVAVGIAGGCFENACLPLAADHAIEESIDFLKGVK